MVCGIVRFVLYVCVIIHFRTGPEEPVLEGEQANRESKATNTMRDGLSGTQAGVAMEVVLAVQIVKPPRALRRPFTFTIF